MVDALIAPGPHQCLVGMVGPRRSPPLKPIGCVPVPVLLPEPLAGQVAHGQHDMRVRLLLPVRRMPPVQRHVRNHALGHELLAHITVDQGAPPLRVQFTRKGDFHFAGKLGVLAPLCRLDTVPQTGAIEHPVGRPIRGHDLPMLDVGFARVVVAFAQALVGQPLARPIGGGGDRAAPGGP